MAISTTTEAIREELLRAARLYGENLSRSAFGAQGPDLKVTLADLEQFLGPFVEAMAGGFLAVSATEQTQRIADVLPCPTCGRECARSEADRTMRGEHGPFTWSEPRYCCEHCERFFFSATDRAEDRPA